MGDELDRLKKQVAALARLSSLQDDLLACYRIGRNPGGLIDRLRQARAKVEQLGALAPKEEG